MNPEREAEISLFNAALELSSAEARSRYLDEACQGDPERRQRIEALIQAYRASPSYLETNSPTSVGTIAGAAPLLEEEGSVIGRYKLLQKIGEGGFGVVYMAEQREPVKRRVALKIIKLGMDTRQVVARFEAERQALALMDHPNIAQVLDGGSTETGRPYFVMELVRGVPVTQFCDENQLSTQARLELFVQVCHALQHAHQKGIIHRDIKPSNILVTLHDDRPVPKVIDFGIAKATQHELTEKTLFTQFRQFIGTPAYMSPEQARWSGLDIDTRSDVYSLGVLLYELLTGRTPFDTRQLLNAGYDEICRRIREEEPPRPSTRFSTMAEAERSAIAKQRRADPRKLGTVLRGDLDWIVMRALEKDRARRYDTANDFAQDIQRYLAHEPVTAVPPRTLYRIARFVRRHKGPMTAAATIAVLLVAGTALSSWLALNALNAQAAAETETERARLFGEAEAEQRTRAEQNEAAAQRLLIEARHEQGQALMASARRLKEQLHFFEANLTAARALGFDGYGRPADDPKFASEYPMLLKPGSPEEAAARLFIDREPDYAPLWRSSVARHHPNPLGDDYFSTGHTDLWQVAFAADGTGLLSKLVTGIRYWNTGDGRLLNEFADPSYAAISPNGDFIVSNDERQFTLRDPNTGQVLRRLEGGTGSIRSIAADRNAKVLALGLADNEIRIYDYATGALLSTIAAPDKAEALALDPSGQWLAWAGTNSWIQLCEAVSGQPIRRLENHEGPIRTLAFAPNGDWLASGGEDQTIRLWSTDHWEAGPVLQGHAGAVHALAFDPNKARLISGGADHTLRVWDLGTWQLIRTLNGHDNVVHAAAMDPPGAWLASGCKNGVVLLWNLETYQPRFVPQTHSDGISSVRVSPDGSLIASGSYDRTVRLWASRSGELVATLRGHHAPVHAIDFSPDGRRLASLDGNAVVMVWDAAQATRLHTLDPGKPLGRPAGPWMRGRTLAFHPDGRRLVSCQGTLPIIWDSTTGERLQDLEPLSYKAVALAWDPSGSRLAAADVFAGLAVWRLPHPKPYLKRQFNDVFTLVLTFDREGTHLIRTGPTGFEFLNPESGKLEKTVGGGSTIRGNMDLVFNSSGSVLAAAGQDQVVRLWDRESGTEMARLIGHKRQVTSLALAPDDSFAVSGSLDGALILWDLAPNRARTEWTVPEGIIGLAFDEKGSRVVAAASPGGHLAIRAVQTGEPLASHGGLLPQGPINWKAAAGADPLYIGSTNGKIQQWDAVAGKVLNEAAAENLGVTHLALNPDRSLLAAFYEDRSVHLWETRNWTETRSWNIGITADALVFHPDGTRLAVTSNSKSVEFWSVGTGGAAQKFEIEQGRLSGVAFSRGGGQMSTGGDQLRIWDLAAGRVEFETSSPSDVEYLAPTVNWEGSFLAVARMQRSGMKGPIWIAAESAIEVRQLPTGRLLAEFPMASSGSAKAFEWPAIAFSPDGGTLAAGWMLWNSTVRVYDLTSILSERVNWASYVEAFHWAGNPPALDVGISSTNLFTAAPSLRMRPGPSGRFLRLQQDVSEEQTRFRMQFWRAYLAENWGAAGVLLEKLKRAAPNPREESVLVQALLQEANRVRGKGLLPLAMRYAEQVVATAPENAAGWTELAQAALLSGQNDRAGEATREWIRLQPQSPKAWRISGDLAAAWKDDQRALNAYNRAIELAQGYDHRETKASLHARSQVFQRLSRLDEARHDRLQGLGLPERDPSLSTNQLDLTIFYNAALDEDLHGVQGNNLKEFLPVRAQGLGGVTFDARGLIHLGAPAAGIRHYPRTVTGIPVKRRVRRLHVLHSAAFDDWYPTLPDSKIGEYVLNYADGTRHVLAIENDVHLHNWWFNSWEPDQVEQAKKAGKVWEGKNEHVAHNPIYIALYKSSWDNPHPDKRIESIDLVATHDNAAPFVLGITVETR